MMLPNHCCLTLCLLFGAAPALFAAEAAVDWPVVSGSGGMHYSPLKQINRDNVAGLRRVWQFDSHDEFEGSEIECNPIVVDGVVYATTPRLRVVALDAASGRLLWSFDAHPDKKIKQKQRNRGLVMWGVGAERRIFVGIDSYIYALSAATGKPVDSFGEGGRIDLHTGLGPEAQHLTVQATSPGVVYRDLLIQGTLVAEDLPAAPGHIRAFDARTGKLRWIFRTIPSPGEFGYETWPKDAWRKIGGANSWAGLTLDEPRGLVFVPTGSASFDFYGANRLGDNLFANCLIALNAATGERVWHFQFVRHDLWDRDLPSAPTLVQLRRDGRTLDAVAQITKNGFIWLFDRDTGKPLVPYRELEAPATDVDGEKTAARQVLPAAPPPFARQQVTLDMLTNRTPQAHAAALEQFHRLRIGPQFTPPSFQGTVVFPGFDGGGEWGGAAWDPETGLFYVNSNEMAWILRLVPRVLAGAPASAAGLYRQNCSGCHRLDRKGSPPEFPSLLDIGAKMPREQILAMVEHGGGRMPGFGQLGKPVVDALVDYIVSGKDVPVEGAERRATSSPLLKYGIDGYNRWLDPDGYPAIAPPWGTLNAVDLNSGRYSWKIPFGEYPELAAQGLHDTGSENYGGGVVTAGGLLFIAATNHDHKLHAFDKATGKLLWETTLPASGNATPAVYQVNGRQYVVIAAGGGKSGEKSGGSYMAFALPE